jgi:hypothetical protein
VAPLLVVGGKEINYFIFSASDMKEDPAVDLELGSGTQCLMTPLLLQSPWYYTTIVLNDPFEPTRVAVQNNALP